MADNPLFYKNIVPLNREKHRHVKLDTSPGRFGFAAISNVIPALYDEFGPGSRSLPIVFSPGPAHPTPVFLMGLRSGENTFVNDRGEWTGDYVPAFVRRYPFIQGDVVDADPLMCFDDAYAVPAEGGEALFLDNGEDSPALKNAIQFTKEYRNAANRTDAFVKALQGLDLFRSIKIDARFGGTETQTVHGLMIVDIEKLKAISDDAFLELRRADHLAAIYAHLHSLVGLEKLASKA